MTADNTPQPGNQQPAAGGAGAEQQPLILGKFKTQADLEKAYTELEKVNTQRHQQASHPSGTKVDNLTIPSPPPPPPAGAVLTEAYKTFADKGSLTEDNYKEYAARGFDRTVVDAFVQGQAAVFASVRDDVIKAAGGSEEFRVVTDWARTNLPKEEADAYNAIIATRNPAVMKLAAQGLVAKYRAAVGTEGAPVAGKAGSGTGVVPFRNFLEYTAATGDLRYATDANFRADVQARLSVSAWAPGAKK